MDKWRKTGSCAQERCRDRSSDRGSSGNVHEHNNKARESHFPVLLFFLSLRGKAHYLKLKNPTSREWSGKSQHILMPDLI